NSCNLVLVFFPSRLCAHLALHSFPTRRSSDLTPQTGVGTMLDHVGILVADWNKAKAFYDAAFAPLGITLLNQIPEQFTGGVKVGDRKSTRLNSSHVKISYAVFCLKKKKK